MKSYQKESTFEKLMRILFIWVVLICVLTPFIWVILSSLKTPTDLSKPISLFFTPIFDNWINVLTGDIPIHFVNSFIVGFVTVGISLLVGLPAAYSISQFKTGGNLTRMSILISEVVPSAVLVVPIFLVSYYMEVNGTILPVILAHLTFILPIVTWFLIGFFDAVPKSLEEQAMIDGCTRFEAFIKIILPQVLPGIGAASIFGFVLSWNDMFYALILGGQDTQTLPVAIAGYNTFRGVQLGEMSVAILVSAIPTIIISFFIQKHLIKGMGGGAVKG
ncbi:carbohydrate ABC transporter membrane protein 2 (CUT1 family) [Bacillus oleivorans]|uniref:Carbohydrate ABC transporter membrane protein 2 (CUT1 family) n=1 Tax=Bacillus oleivorans TaxID=1448271 RepID=A0A285CI00_9BACI|nr:carbohydrate ABC transporter permease [Bacillus oleivorans]SNX67140.1 carbohydrate ABC transporter membrane protein 2 (CUT1 family) [Bacillus oleivorans]